LHAKNYFWLINYTLNRCWRSQELCVNVYITVFYFRNVECANISMIALPLKVTCDTLRLAYLSMMAGDIIIFSEETAKHYAEFFLPAKRHNNTQFTPPDATRQLCRVGSAVWIGHNAVYPMAWCLCYRKSVFCRNGWIAGFGARFFQLILNCVIRKLAYLQ